MGYKIKVISYENFTIEEKAIYRFNELCLKPQTKRNSIESCYLINENGEIVYEYKRL